MTTHRLLAIAGVVVLAASAPVAAADDDPKLFPEEARKSPYARLFTTPSGVVQRQPTPRGIQARQENRPRVVCGMVVIPVDADMDPHMRKSRAEGDDTTYTIRAIKPPMCWQD